MVEHVHDLIKQQRVNIAIDFTMGCGKDTLVLSQVANIVYSFDIQEEALQETRKLIGDCDTVHLIKDTHVAFDNYVKEFDIGIFNLGYFPKGNPNITTKEETSVLAIQKAIRLLNVKGTLYIVVYIGHQEGEKESKALLQYVKTLPQQDYNVAIFQMLNKQLAPYVIEIEKIHNK
jgi:16S rRNA C1402 N4-methylase RsmH